ICVDVMVNFALNRVSPDMEFIRRPRSGGRHSLTLWSIPPQKMASHHLEESRMKAIADALVYAVTYINLRGGENEAYADDDVGALESIAGMLHSATAEEEDALA